MKNVKKQSIYDFVSANNMLDPFAYAYTIL